VVALPARHAEEALLQDGVVPVPERQPEAHQAPVVAEPEEAVLPPAVRAQVRVVEREVVPGLAVRRVVLADRAPLTLGQVRPPAAPLLAGVARVEQAAVLGGEVGGHPPRLPKAPDTVRERGNRERRREGGPVQEPPSLLLSLFPNSRLPACPRGQRPPPTGSRPCPRGRRPPSGGSRPPSSGRRRCPPRSRPPSSRRRPPPGGHRTGSEGHRPPRGGSRPCRPGSRALPVAPGPLSVGNRTSLENSWR